MVRRNARGSGKGPRKELLRDPLAALLKGVKRGRGPHPREFVVRAIYSATCLCGHAWDDHHCQRAQDPRVIEILGTAYGPEECEFFGSNEEAGLDDAGELHCVQYVDRDDPAASGAREVTLFRRRDGLFHDLDASVSVGFARFETR